MLFDRVQALARRRYREIRADTLKAHDTPASGVFYVCNPFAGPAFAPLFERKCRCVG